MANQYHDFDAFLDDIDLVVVMVKHDHIKQNWDKLKGKVILDCHNICPLEGTYHIYPPPHRHPMSDNSANNRRIARL